MILRALLETTETCLTGGCDCQQTQNVYLSITHNLQHCLLKAANTVLGTLESALEPIVKPLYDTISRESMRPHHGMGPSQVIKGSTVLS